MHRLITRVAYVRAAYVALLLATCTLNACDKAAVSWADDVAVITNDPSPLTHPPMVTVDSTMRDSSPTADRLLLQDLLRETTAATLLMPRLLDMAASRIPESRDANRSSKSGAPASATASVSAATSTTSSPSTSSPPTAAVPSVPAMAKMPAMVGMSADAMAAMHAAGADATMGTDDAPIDSLRCPRSLRMALAPGRGRVAVWFTRRQRGQVRLVAAWRDTSITEHKLAAWRGPIVVDSLDQGPEDPQADQRGAAGCAREAPSVVIDGAHGYVHVGYALTGPEGPGVFYAHQMDPRAGFEIPQAIVYGERLGAVRVAAQGEIVAVAYDDPNGGERPRIGLAVSRTSGHLFEERIIASSAIANARDPYLVLAGRAIVVGWSETPSVGGPPLFRVRRAIVH